jgi:molybdenum cofactor biosynthesis enzyme MoaA
MKYYNLLKLNNWIKNPRLKLLGIYLLHILRRRYLAVHFDPVNACNLRCKMCYFTDQDYVKKLKGVFPQKELELFAKAILSRALKLQIGCGTEPTLYKNLLEIIQIAKLYKVPYISLTTNANTIELESLKQWCQAGLNEITVSLHGVNKETYENLMSKGDFNRFLKSLQYISNIKEQFPNFKLRINYTFNEDNFDQLADFWKIFGDINIDTLQIRPIKNMGNTAYQNFSMKSILPKYNKVYKHLLKECQNRNTLLLAPQLNQLIERKSLNSIVQSFTYCYISPTTFWKKDFDWKKETFDAYSKRTNWAKYILLKALGSSKNLLKLKNESLNYELN